MIRLHNLGNIDLGGTSGSPITTGTRNIDFSDVPGALRTLILKITVDVEHASAIACDVQDVWTYISSTLRYHVGSPMFAGLQLRDLMVFEGYQNGKNVPTDAVAGGTSETLSFTAEFSFYDARKGTFGYDFMPRMNEMNQITFSFTTPVLTGHTFTNWTCGVWAEADTETNTIGLRRELAIQSESDRTPRIGGTGQYQSDVLLLGTAAANFAAAPNITLRHKGAVYFDDFALADLPPRQSLLQNGYGAGDNDISPYAQPIVFQGKNYKNTDVKKGEWKIFWSAAPTSAVRYLLATIVPNNIDDLVRRFPGVFGLGSFELSKLIKPALANPGVLAASELALVPYKFSPTIGANIAIANKVANALGIDFDASKVKPATSNAAGGGFVAGM